MAKPKDKKEPSPPPKPPPPPPPKKSGAINPATGLFTEPIPGTPLQGRRTIHESFEASILDGETVVREEMPKKPRKKSQE
jgi:hypothetical protein